MACIHFALCYECFDHVIWKLGMSLPASYIGCTIHYESICSCHFGIPSSWVQRDHSSGKSSQWGSVMECRYWIHSCISYTLLKHCCLLPHVVRTVARISLPHHGWNPQGFHLANSQKTCFLAVGIFKKPVS